MFLNKNGDVLGGVWSEGVNRKEKSRVFNYVLLSPLVIGKESKERPQYRESAPGPQNRVSLGDCFWRTAGR